MLEVVTKAADVADFIDKAGKAMVKAGRQAQNATAHDARRTMAAQAKRTQGEGISGVIVSYATPREPNARVLSTNWSVVNPSAMSLAVDGGQRFKKAFLSPEMPSGNMVMIPGRFVGNKKNDRKVARSGGSAKLSNQRAEVAAKHGFVGIMRGINAASRKKTGIFMRRFTEGRKIRILYSLKTVDEANALQVLGVDVVLKNFEKRYDEKVQALLGRLTAGKWGRT